MHHIADVICKGQCLVLSSCQASLVSICHFYAGHLLSDAMTCIPFSCKTGTGNACNTCRDLEWLTGASKLIQIHLQILSPGF